ncbi:MAG: glycosyltransferase [Lachnospiraceae bacterium]
MSKNFSIAHFGAFNVNSFGDSLFPFAMKKELEKSVTIRSYYLFAPQENLNAYNDNKIVFDYVDFDQCMQKEKFDFIIIGGGEFLHFKEIEFKNNKDETITYEPGYMWQKPIEYAKKYGIPYILYGAGIPYEFSEGEKRCVHSYLMDALYIGVRDRFSYNKLVAIEELHNKVRLSPDSLWTISNYYCNEELQQVRQTLFFQSDLSNNNSDCVIGNYLVLQYGTTYETKMVAKQVEKIAHHYGLKVVLLPINYSHEDLFVLQQIYKQLACETVIFDELLQPKEILAIISGACLFIGTSLHGSLVANCYGVTSISVDMYPTFVSKIDGYLDWTGGYDKIVSEPENLFDKFSEAYRAIDLKSQGQTTTLKKLAEDEYEVISNCISENKNLVPTQDIESVLFNTKIYLSIIQNDSVSSIQCLGRKHDNTFEFALKLEAVLSITEVKIYFPVERPCFLENLICNINEDSKAAPKYVFDIGEKECIEKKSYIVLPCDFFETFKLNFDMNVNRQDSLLNSLFEGYYNLSVEKRELEVHNTKLTEREHLIEKQEYNKRLLESKDACIALFTDNEQRLYREIQYLTDQNSNIEHEIETKDECITLLADTKKRLNQEIQQLTDQNSNIEQEIETKDECIALLADTKKRLNQKIQQLSDRSNVIEREIVNKDGHIELLLESERRLEREIEIMKASRTWRLAAFFQRFFSAIIPVGSKRRLFAKICAKIVRHPIKSAKMLSPRKIRHFFHFLKEEGPSFVSNRIDESMKGVSVEKIQLEMNETKIAKGFSEYQKLQFIKQIEPKVSIVIPVYNQFHYTYDCLKSILKNSGNDISYEVIIANDCSTDDTTRISELVQNITVVTNDQNLRFSKNCNNAATYAKGNYILFLNNDTEVQENWLKPLVELMEQDPKTGMVGSKLIYGNGKLQEAGGILWKDGSAWNYGNNQDPANPEFNYVKEVDYISGAAIMVRKSIWETLKGFDERFAPAYYEDTDLAFEVRRLGYKVKYQPLSTVVHFEGITNGTDVNTGQKAYQIENQRKFYEKWKDTLSIENYENGTNVFIAKDRSEKKKTLLMVDHYVPMYDKDAGSRCMFYYLKLFIAKGYNVKFIGDNFFKHEPYTTTLQQMGIEVLYGNYYYANWKDWIKRNGKYFDYVFLSRPHISIKYIDILREYTKAKIIYFGHDLHYLRELREYELNGNKQALKDSKEWKKTEFELMRKSDMTYYLSNVELDEIAKEDPNINTRRVPINIYEDIPEVIYDPDRRQDIIFVGGFGHPPNIDAVKWLGEEIMPKVWEVNPDIVLHIVGSKPPQEVKDFASERFIVHGFVSDEDLETMYKNIKAAIVPLRYGAGIKGKIIEAMMRGIPMITTSVGIEGIEGAQNIVYVQDEAEKIAKSTIELYNSKDILKNMSRDEVGYINDNYSVKAATDTLENDFDFH